MKKAFTLVEVLVVVIVLGILATIALPQFIKIARRSRLAEAWAGLGALKSAEAVYYMNENKYGDETDLDFNPPSSKYSYTVVTVAGPPAAFTAYALGDDSNPDISGISAWIDSSGNRGSGGV